MSTDTTFFTNEEGKTLLDRFKKTISKAKDFDALVGYFRFSGFHQLYKELEDVEKIRILVGMDVDNKSYELIEETRQGEFDMESHTEAQKSIKHHIIHDANNSKNSFETEQSFLKFKEFLQTDCINPDSDFYMIDDEKIMGNGKKLEFKVYPSKNIHAKVYITKYKGDYADISEGSVITGSSNFSLSGLKNNREFNVELKNPSDVQFALIQFNKLWKDSIDISEDYISTLEKDTWLNDEISPYELYLKMLYEYFQEDIFLDKQLDFNLPDGFLDLEYQKQAVASAKKILDAYNGVFIADVVGLGKTYISALLAQQLSGGKLIICPPVLKEYWEETFLSFNVACHVESMGKLDTIVADITANPTKYSTIFIDEAHRFRNEDTKSFEKLLIATKGKKIVLVSATPLNNKYSDILSQIKLFQKPRKSMIPGLPNLEDFFNKRQRALDKFENRSDEGYTEAVREGAEMVRDRVLRYIMVRRTRTEIKNHFSEDITARGLFFPEVAPPKSIVYEFDENLSFVFQTTLGILKKVRYSRYTPKRFIKEGSLHLYNIEEFELQQQKNLGGFMKGILVKRLESSFYAFKKSVGRFINSYEDFIKMFESGKVHISKKINVYDIIGRDDLDELLKQFGDDVQTYESKDFIPEFKDLLNEDLESLKEIKNLWKDVDDDPKLDKFIDELTHNEILKDNKIVLFTESKETGEYLFDNLNKSFKDNVLFFSSQGGMYSDEPKSRAESRRMIKENFDPNYPVDKNDFNILVTTDILAEGINLHLSNIITNYDLPWNPTKVLQRVGRVNRVGTKHEKIFIFNFFPTDESNQEISLEANIKNKLQAFHDTLGEDSKYLSDDEIVSSHKLMGDNLYEKLTDKDTYDPDDANSESELEYLKVIRDIRDNDKTLFEKIIKLPKKSRSAVKSEGKSNLITFFRKGQLKKFIVSSENKEITFFDAVKLFDNDKDKPVQIQKDYYNLLKTNQAKFDDITTLEESAPSTSRRGRSNETFVITRLKAFRQTQSGYTEEDEKYLSIVFDKFTAGEIPKTLTRRIKKKFEAMTINDGQKALYVLKNEIPDNLLIDTITQENPFSVKREVILSEYFTGDE